MINKPLAIAIALLISFPAAYGQSMRDSMRVYDPVRLPAKWTVVKIIPCDNGRILTPSEPKRGRLERLYDWAKAKKDAHPKLWHASVFGVHVMAGTLQAVSAVAGLKR